MSEIIPYHELPRTGVPMRYVFREINLDDGESVSVGLAADGSRAVEMESPQGEGKRSRLTFALTMEAAAALGVLLEHTFRDDWEEKETEPARETES